MEGKPVAEQDIGRQLLKETANYCESSVCRRKLLLHYFGEKYEPDDCGNCDNCLHPKKKVDAQEQLLLVLRTVQLVKENFKRDYIIDILRGNETETVLAHRHDTLETFGQGADVEETLWTAVINQAMLSDYLHKEVEDYGLLKLTREGKRFMKNPVPFLVMEDNDFDDEAEAPTDGITMGGADQQLHALLLSLRKSMARKFNVPPYVIFQDISLDEMTTQYPVTLDDLQNLSGVGAGKAKRYGQPFCDLIRKYCEENDIQPRTDLRVRTVASKSKLKVSIIQSIDRQVALDDIALMNGMEFGELLDEIESIVYSGTRLNIDYFLEEIMDEDRVEDIYEYFRESDTDDLDTAFENLDDDYTEEDIRLVRIKFLSELAN